MKDIPRHARNSFGPIQKPGLLTESGLLMRLKAQIINLVSSSNGTQPRHH